MPEFKPDQTIIDTEKTLRRISGIIKRSGRKILKNYPITSPQFIALQWVIDREKITIGELSDKIDLAFSTTTDLVDRMENNKLVVRKKDQRDKRVVRIEVLPIGFEIVEKVLEERIRFLESKLDVLSEEEIEALNEGLESLYNAMKRN